MSTWSFDKQEIAAGREPQFELRHGYNASPASRWQYGACVNCGQQVCHDTQDGTVVLTDNQQAERVICGDTAARLTRRHSLTMTWKPTSARTFLSNNLWPDRRFYSVQWNKATHKWTAFLADRLQEFSTEADAKAACEADYKGVE